MIFMQKDLRGGSKGQMISRKEAEQKIAQYLDTVRLKKIIRNTSIVAWGNKISDIQVDNWLHNFTGRYFEDVENERKLALWLLAHFSYYTYDDVRILCKNLFNQYLHEKLRYNEGGNLHNKINEIIKNTLFVGLGNDSESGNNILYYFRQENQLSKISFEINSKEIYENLVYVDDVTISGSQALNYIESRNIKAKNIYVATLIATKDAIDKLGGAPAKIKTISTMILDDRDRAFSESAYVFSDKRIMEIRSTAEEFCSEYGQLAGCGKINPLGYQNGQYMISFEYNTPDNTLPIFWGIGNGWIPLFTRYPKIYTGKEHILDGRKYY